MRSKFEDWATARGADLRAVRDYVHPTGVRYAHLGLSNFALSHWIPLVQMANGRVHVVNRSPVNDLTRAHGYSYPLIEVWGDDNYNVEKITAIADIAILKDPDHDLVERIEAHRQIAHAFAHRDVEIITVTVTAGAYFLDGALNLDLADDAVKACLTGAHRGTPVGILAEALFTRYKHERVGRFFRGGARRVAPQLAIMPLDNMDNNGETLRRLVLQYAKAWRAGDAKFLNWLEDEVLFLNTSADRIVEEPDIARRREWLLDRVASDPQLAERYPDLVDRADAAMFTEPFGAHRLIVAPANIPAALRTAHTVADLRALRIGIDPERMAGLDDATTLTDLQKLELAFPVLAALTAVGAKFVPSVTPFRAAKRSLVNTVHLAASMAGGLAGAAIADSDIHAQNDNPTAKDRVSAQLDFGLQHMHEAMQSDVLAEFLGQVQDEFIPVIKNYRDQPIPGFPDEEIREMGAEAIGRFANPQLLDELARPRRNAYDKMADQVVPYVLRLEREGKPHAHLDTVLGLWILTLAEKSRTAALFADAHPKRAKRAVKNADGSATHRETLQPGVFQLRDERASKHKLDAHEAEFYRNPLAIIEALAPADLPTNATATQRAFHELHETFGHDFEAYLTGAISRAETLVTLIAHELGSGKNLGLRDAAEPEIVDISDARTLRRDL